MTLDQARERCLNLARRHGENFTVLSLLAPRALRVHLAVVYAYCRAVDDLGDEGRLPPELSGAFQRPARLSDEPRAGFPDEFAEAGGRAVPPGAERVKRLDAFERELERAWRGEAESPLYVALAATAGEFSLSIEPFRRLVEANRMDQTTTRYATYADLVRYCEHSATPVGRVVLRLYGICDEEADRLSDATCTALQLANFWQDVTRDFEMGRIYLPQEDMARFGVSEADLSAERGNEAFRHLLQFEVERARALFVEGLPLVDRVSGHLRVDLALFSRGGLAILDKIEKQGYDTIARRPRLSKLEKGWIFLTAVAGKR